MPQKWLSLFKVDQLVKNKLTGDTEKTNQKKKKTTPLNKSREELHQILISNFVTSIYGSVSDLS